MLRPPNNVWDEAYLLSLIQDQVEESLHLDYKACGSLNGQTEGKKNELSKDVSSFANADGGIIIYGIVEGTGERKHLPESLDSGFDPRDVSKEWLEGVINSRIHHRIPGLHIYPIELRTTNPGKYAYAVEIPRSYHAPHQANDNRYYKRSNFSSKPMEHYEVLDVMNRQTGPDLELICSMTTPLSNEMWQNTDLYTQNGFRLQMPIVNHSNNPAEYMVLTLYADNRIKFPNFALSPKIDRSNPLILPNGGATIKYVFDLKPTIPIFDEEPYHWNWGPNHSKNIDCYFQNKEFKTNILQTYQIQWKLCSPRMTPRYGLEQITYFATDDRLSHKTIREFVGETV